MNLNNSDEEFEIAIQKLSREGVSPDFRKKMKEIETQINLAIESLEQLSDVKVYIATKKVQYRIERLSNIKNTR